MSDKKFNRNTTQEIAYDTTQEIFVSDVKATYNANGGTSITTQEKPNTTQEITLKILQLIRRDPGISRKALAGKIGISESGIKYHLDKLKKKGRIEHIGPTKKGYWKINRR